MNTNNGNRKNDNVTSINSVFPNIIDPETTNEDYKHFRKYEYENINFLLEYTGSVIIVNGFLINRYVHMGFQSPISFENVIQLTFKNGNYIESNDLSIIAKNIREKENLSEKTNDELDDKEWLLQKMKWINNSFDLSYNNSPYAKARF